MSYLTILRPVNCLFTLLCAFAGAFYHASAIVFSPALAAALSAGFIAASGYVINDVFDVDIDRINRPGRPLPAGRISLNAATRYALLLAVAGLISAAFTRQWYCMAIAVFNSLLLYAYARWLKAAPLIGNLVVAYAAASVFVFGGLANHNLLPSLGFSYFAFFYTLVRELVKDAQDIEGDTALHARTLAILIGEKPTLILAMLPALAIIAGPWFVPLKPTATLLIIGLTGIPPVLALLLLLRHNTKKTFAFISTFLKFEMFLVLILVWIG